MALVDRSTAGPHIRRGSATSAVGTGGAWSTGALRPRAMGGAARRGGAGRVKRVSPAVAAAAAALTAAVVATALGVRATGLRALQEAAEDVRLAGNGTWGAGNGTWGAGNDTWQAGLGAIAEGAGSQSEESDMVLQAWGAASLGSNASATDLQAPVQEPEEGDEDTKNGGEAGAPEERSESAVTAANLPADLGEGEVFFIEEEEEVFDDEFFESLNWGSSGSDESGSSTVTFGGGGGRDDGGGRSRKKRRRRRRRRGGRGGGGGRSGEDQNCRRSLLSWITGRKLAHCGGCKFH